MNFTLLTNRCPALSEFFQGLWRVQLWLHLGWRDIGIRYKRTILGPLWITLSTVGTFVALGMLYSALLKNDIHQSLPHLAVGLVTWNLLSGIISEAPHLFLQARHIITTLRLPLTVHVARLLSKHFFFFFHNLAAALLTLLILDGRPGWILLCLLLTIPLLFVILFPLALLLGMLGTRFRDLEPIIGIFMQLLFFLTPILWSPADLPLARKYWVTFNPLYHLIEMVRAPMLGQLPELFSLGMALGSMVLLLLLALWGFCRFKNRIIYWF
ncbi:ABC transporter permease [Candidatus Magnetaquicoccus inordinatus]|uniref:ABC transporter permease n=1 Tax=Candidatus Magnetaquicoccus inordinatus TaxID=2496818 RepID=UPI00102D17D5|nr:ABC transporter permease [Candidatus Magnetaquicoccus inordinatus]